MSGHDLDRVIAHAQPDLDELVAALPAPARRALADGPMTDPHCRVCTTLKPNGNCVAYADAGERLDDWHHVSLLEISQLTGLSVTELRQRRRTDPDLRQRTDQLIAAVGAARCQLIYQAARDHSART